MTAYRLKMDHMEAFRENVRAHLMKAKCFNG